MQQSKQIIIEYTSQVVLLTWIVIVHVRPSRDSWPPSSWPPRIVVLLVIHQLETTPTSYAWRATANMPGIECPLHRWWWLDGPMRTGSERRWKRLDENWKTISKQKFKNWKKRIVRWDSYYSEIHTAHWKFSLLLLLLLPIAMVISRIHKNHQFHTMLVCVYFGLKIKYKSLEIEISSEVRMKNHRVLPLHMTTMAKMRTDTGRCGTDERPKHTSSTTRLRSCERQMCRMNVNGYDNGAI